MISRILVATDFTESSKPAVETARALAEKLGATLLLMNAWEPPIVPYPGAQPPPPDELRAWSEASLDFELSELRKRGARVEPVLRCGVPWEQIPTTAKELGADLVVLGTHGHRGFKRFVLGSTADRVVRSSEVPVMVVPARAKT
jgi:nucleotide-binding universal stress UspA family protein